MVGLGPLYRLPGGAGVEGDEGGEVRWPERVLGHPIGELAGQVHPSQARHAVEISKVCLNLDTTYYLSLKIYVVFVSFRVKVSTFKLASTPYTSHVHRQSSYFHPK